MRLRSAAIALTVVGAFALGACGGEKEPTPTESSTPAADSSKTGGTETGTTGTESTDAVSVGHAIGVTVKDGAVTPSGQRVEVTAGEPITFVIDSDVAGELHAHSSPEHEIEFEPGTTEAEITIDRPGIVDVELHEPATLVVQLEVR